jgi:predicted Rossmann fold nucleotide-binding protein DprA/Smf involved in DNA uptake
MLVLASLPGLTARRLQALAGTEGTAAACLAAVRAGRGVAPEDRDLARGIEPRVLGDRLSAAGARMALPGDPDFPDRILDLADPPPALFVRGGTLADLWAPRRSPSTRGPWATRASA